MRAFVRRAALCAAAVLLFQPCASWAEDWARKGPSIASRISRTLSRQYFEALQGDRTACKAVTAQQSPVNIPPSAPYGGGAVVLNYAFFNPPAVNLKVVKNDHTVEIEIPPEGPVPTVEFTDRSNTGAYRTTVYRLKQFHFHHPSEHLLGGARYPMEMHLVHEAADGSGRKLVLARHLVARGPDFYTNNDHILRQLFRILDLAPTEKPQPGTEVEVGSIRVTNQGWPPPELAAYYDLISSVLDCCQKGTITRLLLQHYVGSLTTPGCTPNVLWFIERGGVGVSDAEVAIFKEHYPVNARPVQKLIEQSGPAVFVQYDATVPFAIPPRNTEESDGTVTESP